MQDTNTLAIRRWTLVGTAQRPRQMVPGSRMNSTVRPEICNLLQLELTCIGLLSGQGIVFGGFTPGNAYALDGLATYSLDFDPPTESQTPKSSEMKILLLITFEFRCRSSIIPSSML